MFGIEVDSWEKLVSEFADMLDSSNMEAWPYVDLTDQRVGVHVDLNWGDPTCEEPLTKFVFGRGAEVKTGALVKAFGGSKALLHFGGGSVKRTGVYDKVVTSLEADVRAILRG